jgi:hypothetical protein
MSVSQQLAVRIQNTIDGPLQQVARLSDVDTWNKMPETYRETYTVLTNELQSTMGNSEIEVIIYANGSSVVKKDGVEMSYGGYTGADIEMAQSAYWNIPGFNLVFPMTFWAAHNEGWIPFY